MLKFLWNVGKKLWPGSIKHFESVYQLKICRSLVFKTNKQGLTGQINASAFYLQS